MRPSLSLFPFLNVLLGIMGVLAFLAVTLPLFGLSQPQPKAVQLQKQKPLPPRLQHSKAYWVECNEEGVVLRGNGKQAVLISLNLLREEAAVLQTVQNHIGDPLEGGRQMENQRRLMLQQLQKNKGLSNGFTAVMLQLELQNLQAIAVGGELRHPIFAIQPSGLEAYSIARALLRTTTRLRTGLEPMWKGRNSPWKEGA